MMLWTLPALIASALAGAVAHEIAHWAVWRLTGRNPSLDVVKLIVRPRAGPSHTTVGDRVAAGAPYLAGLVAVAVGWLSGQIFLTVFGAAMFQIPSAADVRTLRGQAEWVSLTSGEPSESCA